jgi:hypothetical protein
MFNRIGLFIGLKFYFSKPMGLLVLVEFVLLVILSELIVECVITIYR